MSTTKNGNASFLEESNKVSMIATATTVILLVAAAIAGYYWGVADARSIDTKNSSGQNNGLGQLVLDSSLPTPPAPSEIYAYSGEVTSIEGKTVYLKTSVQENGVLVEKDLIIATSDNTQFSKLDITKPPVPPGATENQAEREQTIQLNEVQVGDRVIAQSNENVKEKTEFQATKIRVLATEL
ncbi:MAG: hypothetical protein COY66_02635 [Candidatus Kerfeldbacteria bacterium CG_4_10_14_0_8_um_filter_42_10]|uniref:DUF5666 domain-containing protein n=1 Tax=Candidatus Kerfeldbacteria bacterium CG_4_10_14_0_8_um_filter_42_10 TaxID=2014248 RepID=A0A2M7RJ64_9BACT|nr:MAG: hypothetical protein COY66_02635 [Candidatus Kerfeldbacteria bacterium CG_4_10_14_0_8_um_filter_42_10]